MLFLGLTFYIFMIQRDNKLKLLYTYILAATMFSGAIFAPEFIYVITITILVYRKESAKFKNCVVEHSFKEVVP